MKGNFEFRRLKKWQQGGDNQRMELAIPAPRSSTGLVLRWCPSPTCQPRRFQIGDPPASRPSQHEPQRTRRAPATQGCTCPYCGTDDADEAFLAPEDVVAARDQIEWAVGEDVGDWAEALTKEFNHSAGNLGGLLSIEMSVSRSRRSPPHPWREDLLRSMVCHLCARPYGVYAIAFYCPDCGAANLATHFRREVALIVAQVDIAEATEAVGNRELAYRLLGNAHEDVVTAFETYLKSCFKLVAGKRWPPSRLKELASELKGNPFQNLNRSSDLYAHLGVQLFHPLADGEREMLQLNCEKRHILGHNLGMADERYLETAEDGSVGETISLLADEVDGFASLAIRIIEHVEESCPEFHPQQANGPA